MFNIKYLRMSSNHNKRYKCFGSVTFYLRTIDKYYDVTEHIKSCEEWNQYDIDFPHHDVIYIHVSMLYDSEN